MKNLVKRCGLCALALASACAAGSASADDTQGFSKNENILSEFIHRMRADENPLRFWQDENGSFLQAGMRVEFANFAQGNSWFGESKNILGKKSTGWREHSCGVGVGGRYVLPQAGELYGMATFLATRTSDTDAAGSTVHRMQDENKRVGKAYLGWRSGDLFSSLDKDFVDITIGRQQYIAGTGFLFFNESSNGGSRGGYWLGDRHAADFLTLAHMKSGNLSGDLFYLKADDNPHTDTSARGATLDYAFGKYGGAGGGLYFISSDMDSRDSMNICDIRFSINPFAGLAAAVLKPFKLEAEYVYEDADHGFDNGRGWYVAPGYQFENIFWKPTLTYRYSSFDENYDPLFYGFNDWGSWYQGEILGEYVLSNSNLDTHMLRLTVSPVDAVTANLIYYRFKIHDSGAYGVTSAQFADEYDMMIDWTATRHLSFTLVAAYADPDSGARQSTSGNDGWSYTMLYGKIQF